MCAQSIVGGRNGREECGDRPGGTRRRAARDHGGGRRRGAGMLPRARQDRRQHRPRGPAQRWLLSWCGMNYFDVNEYVCIPSETKIAYVNKRIYCKVCSFRMFPTAQADLIMADLIIEHRESTPYEFFVDMMSQDAIDWCNENDIEFYIEKIQCYKNRYSSMMTEPFEILILDNAEDAVAFKLRWL